MYPIDFYRKLYIFNIRFQSTIRPYFFEHLNFHRYVYL